MEGNILRRDAALRDQFVQYTDWLDAIGPLCIIPKFEVATIASTVEYFESDHPALYYVYSKHTKEFSTDVKNISYREMCSVFRSVTDSTGANFFEDEDRKTFKFPYAGTICFTKRGVLRMGLLLKNSERAQELRAALWDEYGTPSEGKVQELQSHFQGQPATRKYTMIEQNPNTDHMSRELVFGLNRAILLVSRYTNTHQSTILQDLLYEILYKHTISLKHRGPMPYFQYVQPNEWPCVLESLANVCAMHQVSASAIFAESQITPNI